MLSNSYSCLSVQSHHVGNYELVPIRDEDKYAIMQWRNDQIDILRQKQPLTKQEQELYFREVISPLFMLKKPRQILFSFLEDERLIGYGGLVHIDWESRNAEVSFITETARSVDAKLFVQDWKVYLACLKGIIRENRLFAKIYTYAYDMRPLLYEALRESFFAQEARLMDHVSVRGQYHDVLIHSYFFDGVTLRPAESKDLMLYFQWANDSQVRNNSFNEAPIILEDHRKWFASKLASINTTMLVAMKNDTPIGQIRFDLTHDGDYEIDFSIDSKWRRKGVGALILARGTEGFFNTVSSARKVIGKVKSENIGSIRSFQKVGFKQLLDTRSPHISVYYLNNPRP